MINRGKILEDYVRSEQVNLTKLAGKLPWTVKTIYRHFQEPDLPFDKFAEYAKALKYDFAEEMPGLQIFLNSVAEPYAHYKTKEKSGMSEAEYYKQKYQDVLEKYNDMLERYNQLLSKRIYNTGTSD